jgi:GAF domain-containing protein
LRLKATLLYRSLLQTCSKQSTLVVATCYQDQPNGLIVLHQCDYARLWTEAELELMQEVADQVGTAIAHASLFSASNALTADLKAGKQPPAPKAS